MAKNVDRFPFVEIGEATGTWPARQEAFFNGEAVLIPEDVVERIETKHKSKSQLAYFVEDLREASNALLSNAPLDEKILGTLDEKDDNGVGFLILFYERGSSA